LGDRKLESIKIKEILQLSDSYQRDLYHAVEILKAAGCTHVFLFGSLATRQDRGDSDIDLAIRGCPKGKFFHLLGQLLLELDHPVDLINLDGQDPFARYLEQEGELLRVD
jgi:predicted nucleotidyltransferase